jgi:hypothetical protein
MIPDATMATALLHCPTYIYEQAPTVCVEGATHSHGSHKEMHDAWDKLVIVTNNPLSLEEIISKVASAHQEIFKSSCEVCIKAQLEAYFYKACPALKPGQNKDIPKITPRLTSGKSASAKNFQKSAVPT